jgi:hypothetical protein
MNEDSLQPNGISQQPSPTTSTYQPFVPDVDFEQPINDNLDAKDRENQPLLGRMDHAPGYNHFPGKKN